VTETAEEIRSGQVDLRADGGASGNHLSVLARLNRSPVLTHLQNHVLGGKVGRCIDRNQRPVGAIVAACGRERARTPQEVSEPY
jgi:hypothetical protein